MISGKSPVKFTSEITYLLAVVLVLSFVAGTVWGQVTASVTGTVRDTSGAVVPEASITVRNLESGLTRASESDPNGGFTVPSLPVGQYEMTVEKTGFKQAIRRGITLVVGQQAVVNLTLEVGEVQQQVTVTGEAPLVNTTLASTSGLVGEKEVKDLPLNGRSFDQLLTLNVGTANASSNRQANQPGNLFSVAGRRPEENRFLMNGVDYIGVSGGANTSTPNGSAGQVMGVDAVREFNVVQHTYGAEYGKRAGGQISIVTTSGTNQLHGSAFEYLRNSALDARNFFDRQINPGDPAIPPFKRNQFGGALGGPIKQDKIFLFGNYEGFRQRLGLSNVAFVPDANARQGLLPAGIAGVPVPPGIAPGTPVPVPGLKPGMLPFAQNFWPAPNGPVLGGGVALHYANPVQKVREDFGLVRFDYNVTAKDSFSANFLIQDGENDLPSIDPVFVNILPPRSYLLSFQETHVFSPAVLNVVTIGVGRSRISQGRVPTVPIPESLSFVTGLPPGTISIGGSTTGAGGGTISTADGTLGPTTYARTFFTWTDDVHIIKGNHTLRAGVWIQRIQSNRDGSGAAKATVAYPTLLAFLTDAPTAFQAVPSRTMLGYRSTEAAWYIQDEIKLRPNLTLRLGLRDEMTNGYNEVKGRCANYVFDSNGIVQTEPRVGPSCLLENNAKALWQPRIGLAWDPTGNGTWAVRTGFGIYNTLQDNVDQAFGANPPFNARLSTSSPLLSVIPLTGGEQPPPSCSPTRGQPCSTFQPGQLDPYMHTPTIQQWSLTVERQLTQDLALQLGYVGSQSYHLQVGVDSNTVRPLVCSDPQGCVSGGVGTARGLVAQGAEYLPPGPRPNRYVSRTFERLFQGTSSYHALNVSLVKRLSHGITFKTNYSYSKVLDMNSQLDTAYALNTPSDILNPYNLALSKGPASFNLQQQFNTNFSYELPFGRGKLWGSNSSGIVDKLIGGWQWNGILQVQPGFPFTPTAGSNRSGSGDTGNPDVPNRNPAFSGPVILEDPNRWYDPNAFLLPIAGTYGNAGRNQFRGPGLTSLDTSLFKRLSINERWNMQFRAEVFNILNHANFGPPALGAFAGTNISPSAGRITSTSTSSRQIQFALKLTF
ncbi:MAG: hypothetical protein A3H28_08085 [Acidobacteria bacterium RIFCSPLOWO2_02_FULL_61_28]|nr:MAG: hypothetical protein A3H28_08085 [Acidobacteria bacterium RIFCSPLOWO2_02_FULL_61_28]